MKNSFLKILFLLFLVNCQQSSNKKIPDNLEFEIRKYLVSEELLYILDTDIDNHKIIIDSIVEFPKYKYLENKLENYKGAYKLLEEGNELAKYKAMNLIQKSIDSTSKIYNSTSKSDNIFKCYTTLQMKTDSLRSTNKTLYLDENYKVIDHNLFDFDFLDNLELELE